ncbi:hypothetical protein EYF80_012818 [Liparis tanakae]|uniref:Uncharacterized protein n=1 Tax=Liparis tanakae TaxID=230148 RepID=A0A4Z2II21_9TELE|nr:hypothetical protein EYF80_012818 [Liparis tanakae]
MAKDPANKLLKSSEPSGYSPITIMVFTSSSLLSANPLSAIIVRVTCSWPGKRGLLNLLAALALAPEAQAPLAICNPTPDSPCALKRLRLT